MHGTFPGNPVRLHGVNWPGMHITHVPSGLDRTPLESLVLRIKSLGFNMVRLTWDVNTVRLGSVMIGPQFVEHIEQP